MLNSIVGPPLKGVADFKSPETAKPDLAKDAKKAGSDSFGEVMKTTAKERDEIRPQKPEPQKPLQEKAPPDKTARAEREEKRRPESDDKAEEAKSPENRVLKKTKGNSQRQDAILNFMDSFESEFGVSPTRIVEAMANLQPGDQADSPEATADDVIAQLGLDDQQEDQAKGMYVGLLAQLAQIEKNPQPIAMYSGDSAATEALVMDRFNATQEKREVLNQSLDSMNQKFWMSGQTGGANAPASAGGTELADKLAQMNLQEKMMQPQGLQIDESLLQARGPELVRPEVAPENPLRGLEKTEENASTQSPEAALTALVAAARAAKEKAEGLAGKADLLGEGASFESTLPPENLQGKAEVKGASAEALVKPPASYKGFEFAQQQNQNSNDAQKGNSAKSEIATKGKDVEKADFKNSLGLEGLQAQALPSLKQDAMTGAAAVAGAGSQTPATPAEQEANVRQIMNQAQYLIKRGGGEMKVEMTPEGLGKIHMKVLVADGKVNVQMAADTQEAKKTLESSLSDLKNSLAAHKLSMDHVKIDVVSGTNTDNTAQNQMNQNQSGSREQTQRFWNNFGENFGSPQQQRSGFLDMPNLRGYGRPRAEQMLEPIQSAGVKKYAAVGKGKGLDLVA